MKFWIKCFSIFVFLFLAFKAGSVYAQYTDCGKQSHTIEKEDLERKIPDIKPTSTKSDERICCEYQTGKYTTINKSSCTGKVVDEKYCKARLGEECYSVGGQCKDSCNITSEFNFSSSNDCPGSQVCCRPISKDAKLTTLEECMFDDTEENCRKKDCYEKCETDTCKDRCRNQYSDATWKDPEETSDWIDKTLKNSTFEDEDQCNHMCHIGYGLNDEDCEVFCKNKFSQESNPEDSNNKSCTQMSQSECNASSQCSYIMDANGKWSCQNKDGSCEQKCNTPGDNEDWGKYTDCIASCQGAENGSSDGCPPGTTYRSDWCTNKTNCENSPRQGKENWSPNSRCATEGDGICSGCFPPYTGGSGSSKKGKPYCTIPENINVVALEPGQAINFDITFTHPERNIADGFFGYINYNMPSSSEQGACGKFSRYACFDTKTRIDGVKTDCGTLKPAENISGVDYKKYCDGSTCTIPFTFIPKDIYECEIKIGVVNSSGSGDCEKTFKINSSVAKPTPTPNTTCNCSKLEGNNELMTRALDSRRTDKEKELTFSCYASGSQAEYTQFRIINASDDNKQIKESSKKSIIDGKSVWKYNLSDKLKPGKYITQCQVCTKDDKCTKWGTTIFNH